MSAFRTAGRQFRANVWLPAILCAASIAGANEAPTRSPDPSAGVRFDQKLDAQVPLDLEFNDEQGRPATLRESFGGKPVVLLLVYFKCPMLCGVELDALSRSLEEMKLTAGREFNVVAVSFDPREGPQLARAKRDNYLKRYRRAGAEQGWRFLTGGEPSIRALADTVGFQYRFDKQTGQYAHAAGLMVLTPQGRLSRYLYGIEYPPRDLNLALVEASQNQIGSLADQLLLLCYHYDPTTGK